MDKIIRYNKYKSCKSKKAYDTISDLKAAAKRLSYRFGDCLDIHGYACRYCGKFHLTTKQYTEAEFRNHTDLIF